MSRPDPAEAFRGTPPASTLPGWYPDLLASVSGQVRSGHRRAVAAANAELLNAYWAIGRAILDRQHEEGYGTRVIDRLSSDLRERFPDARGYSPRNLKYMRTFAAAWPDPTVVQGPLAQLPWYHQIALIEKLATATSAYGTRPPRSTRAGAATSSPCRSSPGCTSEPVRPSATSPPCRPR